MSKISLDGWKDTGERHRSVIPFLINKYGWKHGAELGLGKGQLFGAIMARCPGLTEFIGVDKFDKPEWKALVMAALRQHGSREGLDVLVMGELTSTAADHVDDNSLDFIFIDGGHSYECVKLDIQKWTPKVRKGGWLLGHDYKSPKWPGVERAVHEAYGEANVQHLPYWVWAVAR